MSDGPPFVYDFEQPFVTTPSVGLATMSGMRAADGGWAMLYRSSALMPHGIALVIDEDRTRDSERSHAMERVSYAVFSGSVDIGLTVHPAAAQ